MTTTTLSPAAEKLLAALTDGRYTSHPYTNLKRGRVAVAGVHDATPGCCTSWWADYPDARP